MASTSNVAVEDFSKETQQHQHRVGGFKFSKVIGFLGCRSGGSPNDLPCCSAGLCCLGHLEFLCHQQPSVAGHGQVICDICTCHMCYYMEVTKGCKRVDPKFSTVFHVFL